MYREANKTVLVETNSERQVEGDRVNPSVVLSDIAPLGTWVEKGQPLARVHAVREAQATEAVASLRRAVTLAENAPVVPDLIRERIG